MSKYVPGLSASGYRVVIDSNMLEDECLNAFLLASPENRAVLTEFVWIEAYKQNALASIISRTAILKNYPEQVVILRGSSVAAALDARAPGIANRMIWRGAEKEFARSVQALRQAEAGDPTVIAQVGAHGQAAAAQIGKILADAQNIMSAMPIMAQIFTADEVDRCRKVEQYTPLMIDKIFGTADLICDNLFQSHPAKPKRPSNRSRPDSFLYRYSLAAVLYLMRHIRNGNNFPRRKDRVTNDFIDINFVTFGTYFNGLMTDDKLASSLYPELCFVLRKRGARVPDDWLEPTIAKLQHVH